MFRSARKSAVIGCVLALVLLVGCSSSSSRNSSESQVSSDRYTQLGIEYLRMGKLQIALEKLLLALDEDSNNAEAHDAIAVLYEKIKQYPDARKHFEASIALQPDNAGTQNNFGRFLCDRGEYEEAFEYLQSAMKMPLNDKKWFSFTNAGRCELMRGKQAQAEAYFRMALEQQNNFAPALLELQRISYRQGNFLSAKAFLQRYLEVAEQTAGTLWIAIETEKALGNRVLAEQYRQLLLQNFSSSYEAKQVRAVEQSSSLLR